MFLESKSKFGSLIIGQSETMVIGSVVLFIFMKCFSTDVLTFATSLDKLERVGLWTLIVIFCLAIGDFIRRMIYAVINMIGIRLDRKDNIRFVQKMSGEYRRVIMALYRSPQHVLSLNFDSAINYELLSRGIIQSNTGVVEFGQYGYSNDRIKCFLSPWVIEVLKAMD